MNLGVVGQLGQLVDLETYINFKARGYLNRH
jgi:hypothetical protein